MKHASYADRLVRITLRAYQRAISPLLPHACRYLPTCSEYALEAVERHGVLRGGWLAARRLLRCHPLAGSGFDPVPDEAAEILGFSPGCAHQNFSSFPDHPGTAPDQGRTHEHGFMGCNTSP
jgi:hypothetical protein